MPADFEADDDWWSALVGAGIDPALSALVSSSGVSMYISPEATATTLRRLAGMAPGSVVVMTFMLPFDLVDPVERPGLEAAARRSGLSQPIDTVSNMSSVGEPAWSEQWLADDAEERAQRSAPAGVRDVKFDQIPAAAALVDAARRLAGVDPATVSEDERLGVLDALESVDRLLTGASMRQLVAVDDRRELDARFGMTPGAYSEQRYHKDRRTWMATIRRGRSLATRLPDIFQALCDGRLSTDRANLIADAVNVRNADLLAAMQDALLQLSDALPRHKEFAQQLRALTAAADQDGPEPGPEDSSAKVGRTGDHLVGVMDIYGLDAVAVEQLINTEVDALRRRWQADVDANPELVMPAGATLVQQAITELIIRGAGADTSASKPVVNKLSLVVDADRVDELDPILASVLSGTGTGRFTDGYHASTLRFVGPFGGDDPASTDHACGGCGEHHQLPDGFGGRCISVTTPDGDHIHLDASRWQLLLCDADISEILLDRLGEPLTIRDRARFADAKMRTALVARDGGCVFPGCDAPASWCDAHHVIEYSRAGRTVIVNLALLCRRHHGIVHRAGWGMERSSDPGADGGFFTITTASGLQMQTQHRSRPGPDGSPAGHRPPDPA